MGYPEQGEKELNRTKATKFVSAETEFKPALLREFSVGLLDSAIVVAFQIAYF